MARHNKGSGLGARIKAIGWLRIILALAVAIIGGVQGVELGLSGVTRSTNPEVALMAIPNESDALAARADKLLLAKPEKPPVEVDQLARASLKGQVLNPVALRVLGYYSDAKGNAKASAQLIQASTNLSRREVAAQFWLIEAAVRENNIGKALSHYDAALLTKPESEKLLFPTLVGAIADPTIRANFLPYMHSDKPWVGGFVGYAIYNAKDLTPLVELIALAKGFPKAEGSRTQEKALIGRLVGEKKFTEAYRIYLLIPSAKAQRVTDTAFTPEDRDASFGVMGWQGLEDADAGGAILMNEGAKAPKLQIFVNPSTTTTVASKLLYLAPGAYNFASQIEKIDRGSGGYMRWQMRCAGDVSGKAFWLVDMKENRSTANINVPGNCKVQILQAVAAGGNGQTGLEAVVSRVAIWR